MEVEIQTANQITVSDGVVVYDGREFYIGYGESVSVAIASGTQGMLRNDIVVVQYEKDQSSGVESAELVVVEGAPAASDPQDPAYSDQDIRTGVFMSQKPFCRVRLNGTAIEGIDMLVGVSSDLESLEEGLSNFETRLENIKYMYISHTADQTNQPWQEIINAYNNNLFQPGFYVGNIATGSYYFAYMGTVYPNGQETSFLIYGYSGSVWNLYKRGEYWSYFPITGSITPIP